MPVSATSISCRSIVRSCCLALTGLLALSTQAQQPPTPVFVQDVERAPFVESLEALGTLRANESVTLSAQVTETIASIHFSDGQRVQKGDVLVEMTNAEEQAQLIEAQSSLEEAERQYRRVESLRESNVTTESLLDERRRAFRIAQAQVQAIESRLQDLRIVAPFDGVVGLRNVSAGALVRPGDTITTLDDDSVMKLDINVPSVYLDVLRLGMEIEAKARALDGKMFKGELVSIASRVDPVTRSVVIRALIPNPDRELRPGLLMTVELQKPARDALLVAEEAIIQRGQQAQVFVVEHTGEGTRVTERQVNLGARQPGLVEITAGLREGEQIVIHGIQKIRDGSEVRVSAVATGDETLQQLLRRADQTGTGNATDNNGSAGNR